MIPIDIRPVKHIIQAIEEISEKYCISFKEVVRCGMDILNERIKERRLVCGYTLLEVARKVGICESNLQRYESGQVKNIPHKNIVKLAQILNCSPSYLMGWVDTPNEESSGSSSLVIPEILKDARVAFSGGAANGLTQDDIDMLVELAEKMKRANSNASPTDRT